MCTMVFTPTLLKNRKLKPSKYLFIKKELNNYGAFLPKEYNEAI